jgi:hypothetical protein
MTDEAERIEHHAIPPKDCRGKIIEVGDTVVTAGHGSSLKVREVTRIEQPGQPTWWVNIRCGGFSTTPDRVAVLEKGWV